MNPGDINTYTDNFDAVWRRVMADNAGQDTQAVYRDTTAHSHGPDETKRLQKFMDDEVCDARLYTLIGGKLSGHARQTLLSIASDERHHLKKLKAKYFILTGKTYTPPGSCPYTRYVPETLRLKVLSESEGAEAYLSAANDTGYSELAETYRQLAADEAHHSQMLGSIIEDMI